MFSARTGETTSGVSEQAAPTGVAVALSTPGAADGVGLGGKGTTVAVAGLGEIASGGAGIEVETTWATGDGAGGWGIAVGVAREGKGSADAGLGAAAAGGSGFASGDDEEQPARSEHRIIAAAHPSQAFIKISYEQPFPPAEARASG